MMQALKKICRRKEKGSFFNPWAGLFLAWCGTLPIAKPLESMTSSAIKLQLQKNSCILVQPVLVIGDKMICATSVVGFQRS